VKKSVVIAGVGGQGVLTAATILANAALRDGYTVIASELHGMAQRGGNVECSVRIGDVHSPIVAAETAEGLVAFEPLEALRNMHKVRRDGVIVTDTNPIIPPLISIGLGDYTPLDEMYEKLATHCRLVTLNADAIARTAGSMLTKNVVMLGAFFALELVPITEETVRAVIRETIKERYVDMNMQAFSLGKEAVLQK
jgi:indolepyruvate ferredoxin oxidoreductase beta subunit